MNFTGNLWRGGWLLAGVLILSGIVFGQESEDDENFISPARPSVSEGATIHKRGVLQIETGGDFDFDAPNYRHQQSVPLGFYYAANNRLRLDFEFETVTSQKDRMGRRETGIGDVNLGLKAIARDKPKERLAVGFSYSIKLPTGNEEKGLSTGRVDHNLRAIFERQAGKFDFIFNASYLNVGRADSDRRASGAQAIFRVDYNLTKKIEIQTEFFGNTVDEELSRGLYVLGAFVYKVNKRLRFDVGARPGFGRDASAVGVFAGFSVGVGNGF